MSALVNLRMYSGTNYFKNSCLKQRSVFYWRRKWQPTPVFLPGESHGQRSLGGCSPWGRTESDTTEVTQQQQQCYLLSTKKLDTGHCFFPNRT